MNNIIINCVLKTFRSLNTLFFKNCKKLLGLLMKKNFFTLVFTFLIQFSQSREILNKIWLYKEYFIINKNKALLFYEKAKQYLFLY